MLVLVLLQQVQWEGAEEQVPQLLVLPVQQPQHLGLLVQPRVRLCPALAQQRVLQVEWLLLIQCQLVPLLIQQPHGLVVCFQALHVPGSLLQQQQQQVPLHPLVQALRRHHQQRWGEPQEQAPLPQALRR